LLAEERIIIKQGPLKKTAALDSSDYQLILLDNYLLITKHKVLSFEEHYTIQRRVRMITSFFFFLVYDIRSRPFVKFEYHGTHFRLPFIAYSAGIARGRCP
jgi:hypothetical protein